MHVGNYVVGTMPMMFVISLYETKTYGRFDTGNCQINIFHSSMLSSSQASYNLSI